TRSKIEVRIEPLIIVVLNPVILPSHAQIQSEARSRFPTVLNVHGSIIKSVVTRKRRRRHRQSHRTVGSDNWLSSCRIAEARKFSLRVNGSLELEKLAA